MTRIFTVELDEYELGLLDELRRQRGRQQELFKYRQESCDSSKFAEPEPIGCVCYPGTAHSPGCPEAK